MADGYHANTSPSRRLCVCHVEPTAIEGPVTLRGHQPIAHRYAMAHGMLLSHRGMGGLSRRTWTAVAVLLTSAAVVVSCDLNPQPLPPSNGLASSPDGDGGAEQTGNGSGNGGSNGGAFGSSSGSSTAGEDAGAPTAAPGTDAASADSSLGDAELPADAADAGAAFDGADTGATDSGAPDGSGTDANASDASASDGAATDASVDSADH